MDINNERIDINHTLEIQQILLEINSIISKKFGNQYQITINDLNPQDPYQDAKHLLARFKVMYL